MNPAAAPAVAAAAAPATVVITTTRASTADPTTAPQHHQPQPRPTARSMRHQPISAVTSEGSFVEAPLAQPMLSPAGLSTAEGAPSAAALATPQPSSLALASWELWGRIDRVFQFTNTYYASRMAIVTVVSYASIAVVETMTSELSAWYLVLLLFHLSNSLLGISALPCVRLYFTETPPASSSSSSSSSSSTPAAPISKTKPGASTTTGPEPASRQVSFSLLRSAFHDIEARLQPFVLRRTSILRACESVVIVQSFLLVFIVVVMFLFFFTMLVGVVEVTVYLPAFLLGVLTIACVWLQTREFDRLRAHQQLQLGAGLEDQEHLRQGHGRERYRASLSAASDDPEASQRSLRSVRSCIESNFKADAAGAGDLRYTAALVEADLRRALYEAAVNRDVPRARRLLEVMEQAVGSKVQLELLFLRMYATPVLWLWSVAFMTYNPLHVACRLGDLEMVKALLDGGLSPNLLDKISGDPFTLRLIYEVSRGRPKNVTNVLGSPLHVAVLHGHPRVIDVLVSYGANLDQLASTSFFSHRMRVTPVFLADAVDVVECLVRHRANILVVPGKGNATSVTVLQRAYLSDRGELATALEEWGADVALTPLHELAAAGDLAAVKHLLSWGLHPDQLGEYQKGVNWRTPLHWACVMGRRAVVAELIAHGADVNAKDRRGRTPLHWAARHNHHETVEELLRAGADPQIVDHEGLTALAFSAAGGLLGAACVRLFVSYGVDVNTRIYNAEEDTCLHLALRQGHRDAALALIEAGQAQLECLNGAGQSAVECCASAEVQYAVKMSSRWVDVVVSFEPHYRGFAQRVKEGVEANYITAFMRSPGDTAAPSLEVMKAASAVVCVLSPGYEHNAVCMEELAFAKQNQVPVVAISCESMNYSEVLQVYLFTRQIVPFRDAIITMSNSSAEVSKPAVPAKFVALEEVIFTIDEDKFKTSLQNLIDGLRDEVELHRRKAYATYSDESLHTSYPMNSTGRPSDPTREGSWTASQRRGSIASPPSPNVLSRAESGRRLNMSEIVTEVVGRAEPRSTSAPPQFSIFLSHGDCHKDFVATLYGELRGHGLPVILDSRTRVSSMKERIVAAKDAILQCSVFLVVLSEQSVKTELVSDQLAFAEDKGKHIVPIYFTKRPSVVDAELRKLLEKETRALIFSDDLSYGRGLDTLIRDLEQDLAASAQGFEEPILRPMVKFAANALLIKTRTKLTSGHGNVG